MWKLAPSGEYLYNVLSAIIGPLTYHGWGAYDADTLGLGVWYCGDGSINIPGAYFVILSIGPYNGGNYNWQIGVSMHSELHTLYARKSGRIWTEIARL